MVCHSKTQLAELAETVFEYVAVLFVGNPDPDGLAGAQSDVAIRRLPRRPDRRCRVDNVGSRHGVAVHFLNVVFRHFWS